MCDRETCRVVLFDLFHTLVDVAAVPGAVGRSTADILGIAHSVWSSACLGDTHEICRPTDHRTVIRAIAHGIDPTLSEAVIDEAARARQRRFDYALVHVAADILQGLESLRARGLRLALVSNASTGEIRAWPDSPLSRLFDTAVFSCLCGYCKPQPEIYRLALDRLGARAHEAVFVGDGGSAEHRGAKRVGLRTVLFTRFRGVSKGGEHNRRQMDIDVEVSDFPSLARWLEAKG